MNLPPPNQTKEPFFPSPWTLLLVPVLMLLPVLLWKLQLPIVFYTFGPRYQVFELFMFCVTVALVIHAIVELRRRKGDTLQSLLPTIVFTLLGLYFVSQTSEYYPKSSDWLIRERAAQAVVEGGSPYTVDAYLYPPLLAEGLAFLYQGISRGAAALGIDAGNALLWDGVFYIYQTSQFFLIMLAFVLCFRLMQSFGVKDSTIAIILLLLFVFNMPLLRTLRNHQINLWLLDAMLIGLIWYRRSPLFAGFALAFGAHVKLYPAILTLPLLLTRHFRSVVWFFVVALGIFLMQTNWGTDFRVWADFIGLLSAFPGGTAFRDNGLHSLVYSCFRMVGAVFGVGTDAMQPFVNTIVLIIAVGVLVWFGKRFINRERMYKAATPSDDSLVESRMFGHLFDSTALILIISPIVWEHHYILAMPLVLWCIATQGSEKPWQIGIAAFLIFAIPTFDVFPFSYHRLAGLLMLVLSSPLSPPLRRSSLLETL